MKRLGDLGTWGTWNIQQVPVLHYSHTPILPYYPHAWISKRGICDDVASREDRSQFPEAPVRGSPARSRAGYR